MKEKTTSLILFVMASFPILSNAQSDYLKATEETKKVENVELGGKTSFVFESKSKDLIITSSINSDEELERAFAEAKSVEGGYHYELIVPADRKRIFTVTKQGTAYSTTVTKMPLKDRRIYYTVTEIPNPIMLENQSGRSDLYPVEKKACLQFTSPISDLKVDFSKKVGGKLERGKAASDA